RAHAQHYLMIAQQMGGRVSRGGDEVLEARRRLERDLDNLREALGVVAFGSLGVSAVHEAMPFGVVAFGPLSVNTRLHCVAFGVPLPFRGFSIGAVLEAVCLGVVAVCVAWLLAHVEPPFRERS